MAGIDDIRETVHAITDVDIRITERHDKFINIFVHQLNDFEEDQLMRTLEESGFEVYPVTKKGHTRKLLVNPLE